jgi:APA family basic amino acid/polyamine antiporter
VGFGIAASIGGTIGVGILRAPGIVATQLPHASWIAAAWLAGGVFAFLGTLCVIELGTSLPKAGGWYVFTREAFGDFPGFVIGWSYWLSVASALSYASVALGEYLAALVPALGGLGRSLGIAILISFLVFQMAGLRPVSRFQELTGYLKGLVFLSLAGACFWFAPHHPASPAAPPLPIRPAVPIFFGLVVALQAIVKTYDGWQTPCFFTEEDRNPQRNLPRSMMAGTLIVTIIYVGLNLAFLSILTVEEIAGSKLAAATAFAKLFGGLTGKVITALAVLNIAGLLNTLYLTAPRILFAMSRDGMFYHRASAVNPRGVPVFATLFSGLAGLLMLFSGSFERIFAFSTVLSVICYAGGYASLFALRRKHPEWPRPFRVWAYPAVPLIALLGSLLLIFGTVMEDVRSAIWAAGLMALSYPAYRLVRTAQVKRNGSG